jgi:hypothetical protein
MKEIKPHAYGVDETAYLPTNERALGADDPLYCIPVLIPVLHEGQFSQALPGHSCQAPKTKGHFP